jgi:hypothetical protein
LIGTTPNYPLVFFSGEVRNANCVGAYVTAGALLAMGSSFRFNQTGVWVTKQGSFLAEESTSITCNSAQEFANCSGALQSVPSGIGFANMTDGQVNTEDISWNSWDVSAGRPELWSCDDSSLTVCNCKGPICTDAGPRALPDGVDAVIVLGSTPFDFDAGSMSSTGSCR